MALFLKILKCSSLCPRFVYLCSDGLMANEWEKASSDQSWANLDQTPNDLDETIFRDLSPTPIPWVLEVCRNRHTFFGAALETIAEKSR